MLGGIAGIAVARQFVSGVYYNDLTTLLLVGLILGILNFFIKPVLEVITFPIRLLTLNLFSIVIMMGLVKIADVILPSNQFQITGLISLFWTALIVWIMSILFDTSLSGNNSDKK